jgi:hypothetical protein
MTINQIAAEPAMPVDGDLISGLSARRAGTEPAIHAHALNPTVIEDLLFLDAWERGLCPNLSAFLRARQIRRVIGPLAL